MQFPRRGNVTKFVFSGHYLELTGSNTRDLFPEIQVWRQDRDGNHDDGGDISYVKISSVGYNATPSFSQHANVYEYVLESPLAVQEGDILGYYQPPSSDSLMGLVSVENLGQGISYFLFGQNVDRIALSSSAVGKYTRTPLISFEYGESSVIMMLYIY